MGAFIDLSGQQCGRWTILTRCRTDSEKWFCVCDCGTFRSVAGSSLRANITVSCGCFKKEKSLTIKKTVIGERFGRLVVKKEVSRTGKARRFMCVCDCGGSVDLNHNALTSGNTKSCGCIWLENHRARTEVDITGQKFGMLSALSRERGADGSAGKWICMCDCGKKTKVETWNLRGGLVISCGCARRGRSGSKPAMNPEVRASAVIRSSNRRARKLASGGSFTKEDIDSIYAMQRGRCAWCTKKVGKIFHIDHRVALALGGSNDPDNLAISCPPCNLKKGAKDEIAWAQENGRLL